nr:hypothetical protein [Tanacetum cinerariifolium]
MEAAVQQSSVDKQCLEIANKELLLENDRLSQQIISQDIVSTVMKCMSFNVDCMNMGLQRSDTCEKCSNLDAEFSKSKQAYDDLLINTLNLKNINDLKAQLQDKDMTICKLKDTIKYLRKNNKKEIVDQDRCDLPKRPRNAAWYKEKAMLAKAEQAFWLGISNPTIESSSTPPVRVNVPSKLPKKRTTPTTPTEDFLNEIMEVKTVFDQMEAAVQQSSVDKQCLEIANKELLLENDQLFQQIISQDIVSTVMKCMSFNVDCMNVGLQRSDSCEK